MDSENSQNNDLTHPEDKGTGKVTLTEKNLAVWKDRQSGMSVPEIQVKHELCRSGVYYHIAQVENVIDTGGRQWVENARALMRARLPEVLEVFDDAIGNKDRKTMNKYLDGTRVYQGKSSATNIGLGFQFSTDKIVEDMSSSGGGWYDVDVEIVDAG